MDRVHDLLTPFRIKHGSRFIKNNAVGLHGKNAGNSYTLLLPAGKHGRRLFTIGCHPHLFQCKIHTFSYFFRRHAQIFRAESHIFFHHGSDKLVVGILKTMPTFWRISHTRPASEVRIPSTISSPSVGIRSAFRWRASVDLPLPFVPMMAVNSPF